MSTAIIWFRYDLRLKDNLALLEACNNFDKILPLYIYDPKNIPVGEAQKWWLHQSLTALREALRAKKSDLIILKGDANKILLDLVEDHKIAAIFWSRRYDAKGMEYDAKVKENIQKIGLRAESFPGLLLNEPWTIKNKTGEYFKVFTPFWKHCLTVINPHEIEKLHLKPALSSVKSCNINELELLPHSPNWAKHFGEFWQPGEEGAHKLLHEFLEQKITKYASNRDVPSLNGTSKLSPHLHFGEISPNYIWQQVKNNNYGAERFLAELGWREFSYNLLYNFPKLPTDNFRPEFDNFKWDKDNKALKAWQQGKTGFPIVDAGMRELWHTGTMHNRVRMIVASFLTKDLFIDWRVGAEWFWNTLVDADLANNSASWQWVAGCGADAAPYFRIFNPILQSEKFDADGIYIKNWIPELKDLDPKLLHNPQLFTIKDYPKPLVDHNIQRKIALTRYQNLK